MDHVCIHENVRRADASDFETGLWRPKHESFTVDKVCDKQKRSIAGHSHGCDSQMSSSWDLMKGEQVSPKTLWKGPKLHVHSRARPRSLQAEEMTSACFHIKWWRRLWESLSSALHWDCFLLKWVDMIVDMRSSSLHQIKLCDWCHPVTLCDSGLKGCSKSTVCLCALMFHIPDRIKL